MLNNFNKIWLKRLDPHCSEVEKLN